MYGDGKYSHLEDRLNIEYRRVVDLLEAGPFLA